MSAVLLPAAIVLASPFFQGRAGGDWPKFILVRATSVSREEENDFTQSTRFVIGHVYRGDAKLKGTSFVTSTTHIRVGSRGLNDVCPPFEVGETVIWMLWEEKTADGRRELHPAFWGRPFPGSDLGWPRYARRDAPGEKDRGSAPYAEVELWAKAVEDVSSEPRLAERVRKLRQYATSSHRYIGPWAILSLPEADPRLGLASLRDLEVKDLPFQSQVAVDEARCCAGDATWTNSDLQTATYQIWLEGKGASDHDRHVLARRLSTACWKRQVDRGTYLRVVGEALAKDRVDPLRAEDLLKPLGGWGKLSGSSEFEFQLTEWAIRQIAGQGVQAHYAAQGLAKRIGSLRLSQLAALERLKPTLKDYIAREVEQVLQKNRPDS
jgi:hypothetical protein